MKDEQIAAKPLPPPSAKHVIVKKGAGAGVSGRDTRSSWDHTDVSDGPWRVDVEPRDDGKLAIKSGVYTILTTGDYFDGGGPLGDRLEWICRVVNRRRTFPDPSTVIFVLVVVLIGYLLARFTHA